MRKLRVLLALDVASIPATQSAVLGLAHLVERIAQVAHDMELVVQNRRPRCSRRCHGVKRLPHIRRHGVSNSGVLKDEIWGYSVRGNTHSQKLVDDFSVIIRGGYDDAGVAIK